MVNDVTGQGAIKGSQIVQGSVKEAQVMKLGSIAPWLAAPPCPVDHLPRQVDANDAVPRREQSCADQAGPAARVQDSAAGGKPGEFYQMLKRPGRSGPALSRTGVPARRRPWRGPGHDRCSSVRIGCVTTPWRRPLRGIGRHSLPPTIVQSTRVPARRSSGQVSGSRSTRIISASLPRSMVPLSFSSKCSHALLVV